MAISKQMLDDLNKSFDEQVKKIRKEEEKKRKEAFAKKEFVNAPSLAEDRSKANEQLLKEQNQRTADRIKNLESKMYVDYGGSQKAAEKHFVSAFNKESGKVAEEFNENSQPSAEQTVEEKRAEFYKETLKEFNDQSQEKSRDQDHGLGRG